MSRAVAEWIGKTDDTAPPPRVQLRVFDKHGGLCPKCTRKLQPKQWACDHIVAIINGGQNRESNLQPLCNSPCHSAKTREDVAAKSDTYKSRSRNVGIRRRKRTIPGRKFNGDPIRAKWVDA